MADQTASITQTNITDLPAWMRDPIIQMIRSGEGLVEEPYSLNPNPRIANFTGQQQQGFEAVSDAVGAGQDSLGIASLFGAQSGIGVNELAPDYMNPYIQAAIDPAALDMQRAYLGEQNRLGSQAASSGAFGGSREALLESTTQRNYFEGIGDLYARGRANAYESALNSAGSDQDRRLRGAGFFADLGNQEQTQQLAGADALLKSGGIQQALNQQQLDIANQDFINQRDWPYQQLSFFRSLVTGLPQVGSVQAAKTTPSGNSLNSIVGGGIAGLGLASAQ